MSRAITSNRSNSNRPNERTACHLLCAGVIPTSLTKMTTLQSLNLGTNRLTGTVPSSFLQIQGLLFLALDNNTLYDANAAPKPHSLTHPFMHSCIHWLVLMHGRHIATAPFRPSSACSLACRRSSSTPTNSRVRQDLMPHSHTLSHSLTR